MLLYDRLKTFQLCMQHFDKIKSTFKCHMDVSYTVQLVVKYKTYCLAAEQYIYIYTEYITEQ